MVLQTNKVDGYLSFESGMNEGASPSRLLDSQTRRNINITVRNRAIMPRAALREYEYEFITPQVAVDRPALGSLTYEENFHQGRIQHVGKYQTNHAEYMMLVINGVIYAVDVGRGVIHVVEVEGNQRIANYLRTRMGGTQANRYYVIFDWPHQPIAISDDLTARRTRFRAQEIPKSYNGTFVHNRLFVANAGTEFGASDPISPSNTDAPLTFKESIVGADNPSPPYPDQFFSLSYIERVSPITAMGYLKQTDGTSPLGFGPMFVSTKDAIHLFGVNTPRSSWSQAQLGSAYIFKYGIVGPTAFTNVGADLFYRGYDGRIFSTGTLYSDQRQWGNTDLSFEIEDSLLTLNKHLLQYSFMEYFDNRVFVSLRPYVIRSKNLFGADIEDYCSNGIGVLEFHSVSGVTSQEASPIWGGIYSGAFSHLIEIDNGLYAVGKWGSNGGKTIIRRFDESTSRDSAFKDTTKRVRSRLYTKDFEFDSPVQDKVITAVMFDFQYVIGRLNAVVFMKCSNSKIWEFFGSLDADSKDGLPYRIQDEMITRNREIKGQCKSAQFRIDIVGDRWELHQFIVMAHIETDPLGVREHEASPGEECLIDVLTEKEDFEL